MTKIEQIATVNTVSRLAAGTIFKGEITSPNDIRIDGTFEGKVNSEGRVVIGEDAVINGDIDCTNLDMLGTIEGNVYVRDTLSLKAGCKVNGNIQTRRLWVELGSSFNGNCRMIQDEEKSE